MSYAEHGPRIFLAGRPNNGTPLLYGDYVLPRKRSEGRLKIYESCSDIRAWSQNPLENCRYFRELAEHASVPGKVIPFDVIIDNLLSLGSRTHDELVAARRELQRYKSLILTPEQEKQLQNAFQEEGPARDRRKRRAKPTERTRSLSRTDTASKDKIIPPTRSVSFVSVCLRTYSREQALNQTEHPLGDRNEESIPQFADKKYVYVSQMPWKWPIGQIAKPLVGAAYIMDNIPAKSQMALRSIRSPSSTLGGCNNESLKRQVYTQQGNEVNSNSTVEKSNSTDSCPATPGETVSQPPTKEFISIDEYNSGFKKRSKMQRRRDVVKFVSSESSASSAAKSNTDSGTGTTSGTESESEDETFEATIIKKDSEIIALKNEIASKSADVEELREVNRSLEAALQDKEKRLSMVQRDLNLTREQLNEVETHRSYEAEGLKQKLSTYKRSIDQLREEVNQKSSICHKKSEEIKELKYRIKEVEADRDSQTRRVDEAVKDAEKCDLALREMDAIVRENGELRKELTRMMHEREELRKEINVRDCTIGDQEEEIKLLATFTDNLSAKYEREKGTLRKLRQDLEEKNATISQHEGQFVTLEREVGNVALSIKESWISVSELNAAYEEACRVRMDTLSQGTKSLRDCYETMRDIEDLRYSKNEEGTDLEEVKMPLSHPLKSPDMHDKLRSIESSVNPGSDSGFGCSQSLDTKAHRRHGYDEGVTLLELRKQRSALQDELQVLEGEIKRRFSNKDVKNLENVKCHSKNEGDDEFRSYLDLFDSLKEIMDQRDNWSREKERLESHVEVLKTQLELLNQARQNGGDSVEEILIQHSSRLICRLRHYIKAFERLGEEQCQRYPEESSSDAIDMSNPLVELEPSDCSNRIVHSEESEDKFTDNKVDTFFAQCINDMLDRCKEIFEKLEGKHEEQLEMVRQLEERQHMVEEVQSEVKRLEEEILAVREEAKIANKEKQELEDLYSAEKKINASHVNELNRLQSFTNDLGKVNEDLEKKAERVSQMEEELKSRDLEITELQKKMEDLQEEFAVLSTENKALTSKLTKAGVELQQKEEALKRSDNLKTTLNVVAEKMELHVEKLQEENEQLQERGLLFRKALAERDRDIERLLRDKETMKTLLDEKEVAFEKEVHSKDICISRLKTQAEILKENLRVSESKLVEMNGTLGVLQKEQEKLDELSRLPGEISRLLHDKEVLKEEVTSLESRLAKEQTSNKELEDNLNVLMRNNDCLRQQVQSLKRQNELLSLTILQEISEKEDAVIRCDKVLGSILALKKQLSVAEMPGDFGSLEGRIHKMNSKSLKDAALIGELSRKIKIQDKQISQQRGKVQALERENHNLNEQLIRVKSELKNLPLRLKRAQRLNLDGKFNELCKHFPKTASEELNSPVDGDSLSRNDVNEISRQMRLLENECKQRRAEVKRILCEFEAKSSAMEALKDEVKSLTSERDLLLAKLEDMQSQYTASLAKLKQTYEKNLKALHEKHNSSIRRLEAQFNECTTNPGQKYWEDSLRETANWNIPFRKHIRPSKN
ncbi:WEB family protein At4g27595, chloroplastic isoform X2 [Orussus abietinus]|uniref:WEB family protein At4g27595, chloroplastic isoform X2 n=1 Tax=Orussus abietinus TaxID=222816 RepID=UPI000C716194|nr:WEB family protein At4g27595, chloroplastic isoform X2 [Orussus abietinus]